VPSGAKLIALSCAFLACSGGAVHRPPATGGTSGSPGTGGSDPGGSGGSGGSVYGGSGGGGSGGGGSGGGGSGGAGGGSGGSGGSGGGSGGSGGRDAGGGGSGGTPARDGGAADTPPATGMPGCMGVTSKFCSDFEDGMAGADRVSAGIVVDATKAFSGTKSLHFKPTNNGPYFATFTKQFPFNHMFGRLMFFMANRPTNGSHWDFVRAANAGSTQWSIGGQFGNFELVCDPPDNGLDSTTPFPADKWVCLQWEFSFDPNGGKTLFVTKADGMVVNKGMVMGPKGDDWRAGAWRNLEVGWEVFQSVPTRPEFWVDDLAFGEQEIPCPAPN
jgi:hypothetical protein